MARTPAPTRGSIGGLASALAIGLLALSAPAGAGAATAYVPSVASTGLTRIDTFTNVAGPLLPTPMSGISVALTPDGATAYVPSYAGGVVMPIDIATGNVAPGIPAGTDLSGIAITPDGTTAYVAGRSSNSVTPIDLATNTAGTPITSNIGDPWGIAVTPDGATAYVSNRGSSRMVVPIDTQTNTAGTPIAAGDYPDGLAITPDGATLYVSNLLAATVTPVDTQTNTAGTPIPVGDLPVAIAMAPDGATAYVVSQNSNEIVPIDTATNQPGTPIPVVSPVAAAVSPDGTTLYVVRFGAKDVVPIDTGTGVVGAPIPAGTQPYAIGISPGQAPIAALSATPGKPLTADLDGSASTVPAGDVGTFAWTFGDGQTDTTTDPKTSHVYATAGTYTITLTTTSADGCSTAFVYTGQTVSCNGSKAAVAESDVTVTAPTADDPAVVAPPPAEQTPTAPVAENANPTRTIRTHVPKTVRQTIERFTLDARCVQRSRRGTAHVGLNVRLARAGTVAVQVDRATGAKALDTCPKPSPNAHYKGGMRDLKRIKGIRTRSASVDRKLTLDLRLEPGLYRIGVRAHTDAGLTKPFYRWVRVLG